MDFSERIRLVLTAPSKFFNAVRNERGFKRPFLYYLLLSIIYSAGTFVTLLLFASADAILLESIAPGFIYLLVPLGWLLGLLLSFVIPALFHIFVYLLGGRKGFLQTYKSYVYALTPELLVGWLPVIGAIASLYSIFYLFPKGLSIQQKITAGRALLVVVIPMAIFFALLFGLIGLGALLASSV